MYTLCVLHSQHRRVSIRFHPSDMTHRTMIIFLGRYLIHNLWKNGYRSEHRAHEANALLHKYLMVTQPGAARKKNLDRSSGHTNQQHIKTCFCYEQSTPLIVKCTKTCFCSEQKTPSCSNIYIRTKILLLLWKEHTILSCSKMHKNLLLLWTKHTVLQ